MRARVTMSLVTSMLALGAWTAAPAQAVTTPRPGDGFHIQFVGTLAVPPSARVVDVDGADTPAETIAALRSGGHFVICYMSAGSWEDWRDDAAAFPAEALGKDLDGWEGERWLDVRSPAVLDLMHARIQTLAAKGCQGVEFDNVDGYQNQTGFPLTSTDQIAYDKAIAGLARQAGLSPGLKNTLGLIPTLVKSYDWALNEECVTYSECGAYRPFVKAKKPVFVLEYGEVPYAKVCSVARKYGLSAQVKHLNLDAYARRC